MIKRYSREKLNSFYNDSIEVKDRNANLAKESYPVNGLELDVKDPNFTIMYMDRSNANQKEWLKTNDEEFRDGQDYYMKGETKFSPATPFKLNLYWNYNGVWQKVGEKQKFMSSKEYYTYDGQDGNDRAIYTLATPKSLGLYVEGFSQFKYFELLFMPEENKTSSGIVLFKININEKDLITDPDLPLSEQPDAKNYGPYQLVYDAYLTCVQNKDLFLDAYANSGEQGVLDIFDEINTHPITGEGLREWYKETYLPTKMGEVASENNYNKNKNPYSESKKGNLNSAIPYKKGSEWAVNPPRLPYSGGKYINSKTKKFATKEQAEAYIKAIQLELNAYRDKYYNQDNSEEEAKALEAKLNKIAEEILADPQYAVEEEINKYAGQANDSYKFITYEIKDGKKLVTGAYKDLKSIKAKDTKEIKDEDEMKEVQKFIYQNTQNGSYPVIVKKGEEVFRLGNYKTIAEAIKARNYFAKDLNYDYNAFLESDFVNEHLDETKDITEKYAQTKVEKEYKNLKTGETYEDFQVVEGNEGYRVTFKVNGIEHICKTVFQNEAEAEAFIQEALNSRDAKKYIQAFESNASNTRFGLQKENRLTKSHRIVTSNNLIANKTGKIVSPLSAEEIIEILKGKTMTNGSIYEGLVEWLAANYGNYTDEEMPKFSGEFESMFIEDNRDLLMAIQAKMVDKILKKIVYEELGSRKFDNYKDFEWAVKQVLKEKTHMLDREDELNQNIINRLRTDYKYFQPREVAQQ